MLNFLVRVKILFIRPTVSLITLAKPTLKTSCVRKLGFQCRAFHEELGERIQPVNNETALAEISTLGKK